MPSPGVSVTALGRGSASPRARAASTIAWRHGLLRCLLERAARRKHSSSARPPRLSIRANLRSARCQRPGLVQDERRGACHSLQGFAPLIKTPKCAARETPATSATGTARIRDMVWRRPEPQRPGSRLPLSHHAPIARRDSQPESRAQRSASRDIGARERWRLRRAGRCRHRCCQRRGRRLRYRTPRGVGQAAQDLHALRKRARQRLPVRADVST